MTSTEMYQAYRDGLVSLYELFRAKKTLLLPSLSEAERATLKSVESLVKKVRK